MTIHEILSLQSAFVLGAGSWGTALAAVLGWRGLPTRLWGREAELVHSIERERMNARYLPGITLPQTVEPVVDFAALPEADVVLFVPPSAGMRGLAEQVLASGALRPDAVLVTASKGIERETGLRMSKVLKQVFPGHVVAVVSGPSHAEEVGHQLPTLVVIGAEQEREARALQAVFTLPWFRSYTSTDLAGIEWGGAMKNIFAIASGIAHGLGLGDNTSAALVTRGLAEMVRLGIAGGGKSETFYGLSGVGDLIVTCFSPLSRNHKVGVELGKGRRLDDIVRNMQMVAEGVPNTASIHAAAREFGVRTPLIDSVYSVLYGGKPAREALSELLEREPRAEGD